jgi:hypothetical protein
MSIELTGRNGWFNNANAVADYEPEMGERIPSGLIAKSKENTLNKGNSKLLRAVAAIVAAVGLAALAIVSGHLYILGGSAVLLAYAGAQIRALRCEVTTMAKLSNKDAEMAETVQQNLEKVIKKEVTINGNKPKAEHLRLAGLTGKIKY